MQASAPIQLRRTWPSHGPDVAEVRLRVVPPRFERSIGGAIIRAAGQNPPCHVPSTWRAQGFHEFFGWCAEALRRKRPGRVVP
jgi:hypothetical protein